MKRTIVICALLCYLSAQPPQVDLPISREGFPSLSGPDDRSPQELLEMFSDAQTLRPITRVPVQAAESLSDPRTNLTQQQLLSRFAERTADVAPEASQQEVQRSIGAEISTQTQILRSAQSILPTSVQATVAGTRTLQPAQLNIFFNWFSCFFKRGLTWRRKSHSCANGLDFVGCVNCNPYQGDTQCFQRRPILCIYKAQDVRPDYNVSNPFYEGWSGGHVKITRPIRGCYIYNKAHADFVCRTEFGLGWRMASHHDGRYIWGMNGMNFAYGSWNWGASLEGGWNFYAYGNLPTSPYNNFWTYIRNQPGNCWN